MDISHKKRPDVRHMFALKWSQQEMAGSRSFLVVLLVATVTCIVLIQVSMDGWIHPGNFKFYNFAIINQKELRIDKDVNIPDIAIFVKSTTTSFSSLSKTSKMVAPKAARSSIALKPTKDLVQKTSTTSMPRQRTAKKALGNITAGQRLSFAAHRQELLLQQQSRLNAIMKRKSISHKQIRYDLMKKIKAMPLVDSSKVNRIFLITYFRSGSSFVGELLQQNWRSFYQFEPLHYMSYGSRISNFNKTKEALQLFNSIYRCNFTNLNNYFRWVKKSQNQFLFARSLYLWYTCRINRQSCFIPDYVSAVCSRAPVVIVKTTRLHMWQLKLFLDENPDLNIKVVYLARDPRGIVSSRWSLSDWCNGTDCSDPNIICSEMRNDISVFNELQQRDPSKFIQIRYEDMATNPEVEANKLFRFLGLSLTHSIKTYLKVHTKANKADKLDPYSTRRDSSTAAFSWKRRFNFDQVVTVQNACNDVIGQLNYSIIYNATELETSRDIKSNSRIQTQRKLIYINNHKNFQETDSLDKNFLNKTETTAVYLNIPENKREFLLPNKTPSRTKFYADKNANHA